MFNKKSILIISILSASLLAKDTIGFNVNSDSIEIESHTDVTGYIQTSDDGTKFKIDTSYLNTTYSYLFGAGFSANGSVKELEGLEISIGAKFIMSDNKQKSFFAIPLMATAKYKLPIEDVPQSFISAQLLYAPTSLSFSDASSYSELRVQADVDVIDNISLFSGYRTIDTDYKDYDKSLDKSIYGGLKLAF